MMTQEPMTLLFALLAIACLVGLFFVSALAFASHLQRKNVADLLEHTHHLFWRFHCRFCNDSGMNGFVFCLTCAKTILMTLYVIFLCSSFLGALSISQFFLSSSWSSALNVAASLCFFAFLFASTVLFSELLPRTWAFLGPHSLLRFSSTPAGLFLILLSPITFVAYHIFKLISPQAPFSTFSEPQQELLELFGSIKGTWSENDKRLFQSVLNFRNRIAREIMRPRVGLFCIPENLTLQQAAELLQREGYSRVPVYRDTIDTIVGILFYKDVLSKFAAAADAGPERERLLESPVKSLVKKVFYCPETKKIASLLQEFKKRQTHLAVVVDEYGGTAGLVTIEDILEEIVGEISDEYDEQEALFLPAPGGGWIVDARMNLLDVEEELDVKIPQEEDYDTLAGYIFYRVGSIPQAGLVLHHDNFEIEILKSNDRMVEKVKITPVEGEAKEEES
jgi:putative hemolysin